MGRKSIVFVFPHRIQTLLHVPEGQGLAGGHKARLWQGWVRARGLVMLPHSLMPPHTICLPQVSLQGFTGRREERCVCPRGLHTTAPSGQLPSRRPQNAEAIAHLPGEPAAAADGPRRPRGPPSPARAHTCGVQELSVHLLREEAQQAVRPGHASLQLLPGDGLI